MTVKVLLIRVRASMGVTGCSNHVYKGNGCEDDNSSVRQRKMDEGC